MSAASATNASNPSNLTGVEDFRVVANGINALGNHWCRHETTQGPSFHYSNADGSVYRSNPDGSTHFDNGRGFSRDVSADGVVTITLT
ncbi:hypothetical protein BKA93DRAFT_759468 [Sparassis latifolia]|uniref:Uncharacterized protein n=1 Tax=Sparassis crispa TaxID=139825 RepID=A0A401H587_9APHY|nr:hypothetical protein SCP_1602700 [Sparassis crispa]GBE89607.1 hypothetical protein SCP_1602700 [Sparassis crispa]